MISAIKPPDATPEGGGIEGQTAHPLPPQLSEIGFRCVYAADIIIDQKDLHPASAGCSQLFGQAVAGPVGTDDVILNADV